MARQFQLEGFILGKFGKPIPIIVHELEYSWYVEEATIKANPNGEADIFIKAMRAGYI